MPKTHVQVIESCENRLLEAIINADKKTLSELMHPNMVLINEAGELFNGLRNMPINQNVPIQVDSINIEERLISMFNNVAVVNTFERRTGTYHDMHYERYYRLTRVWKFSGKNWKVISATLVQLNHL